MNTILTWIIKERFLQAYLNKVKRLQQKIIENGLLDNHSREWYNKIRNEVLNECCDEIVEIAKKSDKDFVLDDNLSFYGKSGEAEFFAEVFANSQLGAPNELGKAMQIWLKKKGLIK